MRPSAGTVRQRTHSLRLSSIMQPTRAAQPAKETQQVEVAICAATDDAERAIKPHHARPPPRGRTQAGGTAPERSAPYPSASS